MSEKDVLQLIKDRKSYRGPFDENRSVDPSIIKDMLEAATWAPTAHNMQNFKIIVVDDRSLLLELSEMKSRVSSVFIEENYRQLSFSEDELKKKKAGILAAQFPPGWLTPEAQKGKVEDPLSGLGGMISKASALLLVLYDPKRRAPASEGDALGIMSLGFMIENMWLIAAANGVSFHVVTAFGNEPLQSEVKKRLKVPASLDIVLGCRIGYPTSERKGLRVRRDIEDFVSYNGYEN